MIKYYQKAHKNIILFRELNAKIKILSKKQSGMVNNLFYLFILRKQVSQYNYKNK